MNQEATPTTKRVSLEGGEGTYRFLTTEEPMGLTDSVDLNYQNLTMPGLVNFVRARAEQIKARAGETNITVNTRTGKTELTIGEHGGRKSLTDLDRVAQKNLTAEVKFSDDYSEVRKYAGKSHRSAHDLAMIFRTMPHIFESESDWKRVVTNLRSTHLKVEKVRQESSSDETGNRENAMTAKITDGQLDLVWSFLVPIYEGEEKTKVEVKAIWEVQSDFTVQVVLLSVGKGFTEREREALKVMTERTRKEIETVLGENTIPFIYVDGEC